MNRIQFDNPVLTKRGVAAALAAFALGGSASLLTAQTPKTADDNTRTRDREKDATKDRDRDSDRHMQGLELQRASKIIGMNVVGNDNEKLGSINNLAVELPAGHVYYAVISSGGVAGVGDTLRVVPFTALKFSDVNKNASINVNKSRFESSGTFDDKGWNTMGDRSWGEKVYQYYSIEPDWKRIREDSDRSGADSEGAVLNLVKGSELIGMDVRNNADENLGDIDDLVVNVRHADIAYAVLSSGGVLGVGDKLFAVPFQSFNLDRSNKKLVLNIDKDRLKAAPGFDKKNWPDMADANYSKQVLTYYHAKPSRVYGYVAPMDDTGSVNADKGRGWDLNTDYGRMILGKSTDTVSGKVDSVDSFNPAKDASEGVQLLVKTDKGNDPLYVHLGPAWYINHQQNEFNAGDDVTVKGVRINLNGKPAIVAYEVRRGDRVMTLRHQDGTPMWDAWHATGKGDNTRDRDRDRDTDNNKK